MSTSNMNLGFSVSEQVATDLFNKAKEAMASGKVKNSSEYVDRLLEWALANYKDENAKI